MKIQYYITTYLILNLVIVHGLKAQGNLISQNSLSEGDRQQLSSPSLIEQAYVRGEIDIDQWALYQAYALEDPGQLPLGYISTQPEKCATWVLDNIHRMWNSLSSVTKTELQGLGFSTLGILSRPIGLDATRTTPHFIVHYTVTFGDSNTVSTYDGDLNGTPDYIDTVLTTIENVWNTETGTMGYTAPPPDSGEGGDNRYDVYIFKLKSTTYGYTSAEKFFGDNPNSPYLIELDAFSSYLALRNNYSGFNTTGSQAIEVTTAHEFYHAIQIGYDLFESDWMSEATATWAEDEVYDNINDNYQYLNGATGFFAHPWYPLDASNYTSDTLNYGKGHWYGSWIFFRYISEHVGDRNTIREILERIVHYDNYSADYSFNEISDVLAEHNTSFNRVFRHFTTANLVRTIGLYRYREGAAYPTIPRYTFPGDTTIASSLVRYASFYFQVPTSLLPDCGKTLTITFTSQDPSARLGADLVSYKDGYVTEIAFQSSVTLPGNEVPDSLFIVVMNFGATGTTKSYTLKVQSQLREAQYILTDLGTIGSNSITGTINNGGRAVGTIISAFGSFYPVTWQNGSMQYLGSNAYAFDINNKNDAVGYTRVSNTTHAFIWGSGGSKDLDTSAFARSAGFGVNDSAHVVGYGAFLVNGAVVFNQPALWKNGLIKELPLLNDSNAIGGVAYDINNREQIIGTITTHQPNNPTTVGPTHTVLWNGAGNPIDISSAINLSRINDVGQYVGYEGNWENVEGEIWDIAHVITGTGGGYSKVNLSDGSLGASFWARDINNAGDIVGKAQTQFEFGLYAFVYSQGVLHNLNEMLGFGTCWWLTDATGINDSGQIFGVGYPLPFNATNLHAFVLTPVTSPTSVSSISQLPSQYNLNQNYPNPFNPTTTIRYEIAKTSYVTLKIYNILGKEVASLVNKELQTGQYEQEWNARNIASGVYFYRLQAGNFIETKKMILLR